MTQSRTPKLTVLALLGLGAVLGYLAACRQENPQPKAEASAAEATGEKQQPVASPTAALENRDVYYPGSEDLGPDEMRVVACGTGMPNARPTQAAACFLVELGNGESLSSAPAWAARSASPR